jgi:hypothetical protein
MHIAVTQLSEIARTSRQAAGHGAGANLTAAARVTLDDLRTTLSALSRSLVVDLQVKRLSHDQLTLSALG